MLFSSVEFLFYFLPLLLVLQFLAADNIRLSNGILLIFSLLFYAWGEPVYVFLMVFVILLNYIVGWLIDTSPEHGKKWLILGVVANLSILAYYKYAAFLIINLSNIFSLQLTVSEGYLPIGISFFIFQAITYIADVYNKNAHVQKNPFLLALYISLFPQLIAGPIIRYRIIEDQLLNRTRTLDDVSWGVRRFIIGLAKKVIVANTFGMIADEIFSLPESSLTPSLVLIGVAAFTFQIYFDFSAYSDMAIGLGRIFGFRVPENFNYPYMSRSVTEFWRRWHISLSSFFRDYVYIPLGGNRRGEWSTYRNLVIVFFLCGLWHGASWNFIIWGLYFGGFLIIERRFILSHLDSLPYWFSWFYTMLVVMLGWLIFRAESLDQIVMMLLVFANGNENTLHLKYLQDTFLMTIVLVAIVGSTSLFKHKVFENRSRVVIAAMDVYLLLLLFVSITFLAADTYNPFIYFRF